MDFNDGLAGRLALSIPDAARAISISRSRLYELMEEKRLATVKIGNRRLVLKRDLEALLEASREAA